MTATLSDQSDAADIQRQIEKGGVDSETWFELRRLFEAMTDRDTRKTDRENEHERRN